jgi:hypothetical protein
MLLVMARNGYTFNPLPLITYILSEMKTRGRMRGSKSVLNPVTSRIRKLQNAGFVFHVTPVGIVKKIAKEGLKLGWFSDIPLRGLIGEGNIILAVNKHNLLNAMDIRRGKKGPSGYESEVGSRSFSREHVNPNKYYVPFDSGWKILPVPPEQIFVVSKRGTVVGRLPDVALSWKAARGYMKEAMGDDTYNDMIYLINDIAITEYGFSSHGSYQDSNRCEFNFINGEFLIQFNMEKIEGQKGVVDSKWVLYDEATKTIMAKGKLPNELIRALHSLRKKGWI